MNINQIVNQFLAEERNVAVLLSESQVQALAIAAVGFYCGYSSLDSIPNTRLVDIKPDTEITISEWVLIKPVFLLYVERETALQTEATGMQGVTGFGRNSSEVNSDISRLEETFGDRASCRGVITIGGESAASDTDGLSFPYGFNYPTS